MHPDFKKLANLRAFMMRGDARSQPDFGRAASAAWIARHGQPLPGGVEVTPLPRGAGLRIAPPNAQPGRAIIYVHGGGLVYYSPQVFVPFLAQLAAQTGQTIFALDYCKAPEAPAPLAFEQLTDSLRVLLTAYPDTCFALAGDSVGGLLATQLCSTMPKARIDALHLIYPVTHLSVAPGDPHGTGHFLDTEMMNWFYDFITPLCQTRPAPLSMPDEAISALPQTRIHIAPSDILAPQGRAFADRLAASGRLTHCIEHDGLPHDFCLYAGSSPAAAHALTRIACSIAPACQDA